MTKEELWEGLCERHPEFKDPEHVLRQRARGLKRIIDQAWEEGRKAGELAASEKGQDAANDPLSVFSDIFKK